MIETIIKDYIKNSGFNYVGADEAREGSMAGLTMFGEPLIGYAAAEDPLFERYRSNLSIMQGRFMHPVKWLPGARTAVSVFFPLSGEVKQSNAGGAPEPSSEWRHARHVGQAHLNALTEHLRDKIIEAGGKCVAPAFDKRYVGSFAEHRKANRDYGGNWSERHAAYAAGLGTFGLSKGLITKLGVAGRFMSVITDIEMEPTQRNYTGVYDYCVKCGECIARCPAGAISFEKGKLHAPCDRYLAHIKAKYHTGSGCGKCQAGVPCMDKAPGLLAEC